jgi:hypothetical protein
MKFGFDVHGVLDTHREVYAAITQALVAAGHEVHVVTGKIQDAEETKMLEDAGIKFTHWFSVARYHEEKGEHEVRWVNGDPWMDDEVWNRTKAQYCHEQGIRMLFDDSPFYGQYFNEDTIFLLQRDPQRARFWEIERNRTKNPAG